MSSPRVTPGGRRELGLGVWAFTRLAGRVTRSEPPNLFTTLGRHRGLFRGWLWFAGRLMPGGKLPRRETELVILRAHYEMLATVIGTLRIQPERRQRGA